MRSSIDTKGLFFSLKFSAALCSLIALSYGGGQVVGARIFIDPALEKTQAGTVVTEVQKRHFLEHAQEAAVSRSEPDRDSKLPDELAIVSERIPATSARSVLMADIETGQIYFEKDSTQPYPIASVTKLMTALVARANIPLDTYIKDEANGEEYLSRDLVYPLFLRSDNTVADSYADFYGRAAFLGAMNRKAQELGMSRTHFDDPSGLSPKNTASPADLYYLAQELYKQQKPLLAASKESRKSITAKSGSSLIISNQNQFVDDSHFLGGKLGFTDEALQTSVGLFSFNVGGQPRVIAVIVLGSYDWKLDTRTLVSWFRDSAMPAPHQAKK